MRQEIQIIRNYPENSIEIWVTNKESKEYNLQYDDSGCIIEKEYKFNEITEGLKPLIKLPRRIGENILKSILDYFEKNGIKTDSQSVIEGKLIATEAHLKDLQSITNKLVDKLIK